MNVVQFGSEPKPKPFGRHPAKAYTPRGGVVVAVGRLSAIT